MSESTKNAADDEQNGAQSGETSTASGEGLAEAAPAQEQDAPPPEEAAPSPEELLEAARADLAQARERTLRVAADFDNFRKRSARDVEDVRRRATQGAVRELLPVFDNLARAAAHAETSADVNSLLDGLRMVDRLFVDTLAKLGIERVPSIGQPFDPALHEGIQHDYSDEHPAGCVMAELQPGYRQGTELLRPALVIVSRGSHSADAARLDDGRPDDGRPADAARPDDGRPVDGAPETAPDDGES